MKFPRYGLVCTIFLLAFSAPSASQTSASASSQRAIPATFFGLSVLRLQTESVSQWPLNVPVGTLGKTEGTEWNDVEPSNGTFDWAPLDQTISEARSAGVTNFIYTLWSTPKWASSEPNQSCILTALEGVTGCAAPPTNINDWDNFVRALVTRYRGEIQYYELWNEANLAETYSGTVTEMVTMAEHAYADIKSIDPQAMVLTPSVSRVGILPYSPGCIQSECWLAEYLQAGGGDYADGVAFHPYACFPTEAACGQLGIACPEGEIQACAGTPLTTEINGIRSIVANYGLSGKPLVATEGGFPSDINSENLTGTADQQTAYVSRWFILQASENVSIAVWFSEFPFQSGLAGFGTAGAEAEINQGYEQTYKWIVGATFAGPCTLSGGLWTCSITSSAGFPELLVWADTNSSSVPYAPPSQFTHFQDLSGASHEVQPGSSITLNEKPILLETTTSTTTTTNSATSSVPTTGSNSTLWLYAVAGVMAAGIALVVLLLVRRRSSRGS